MANIFKKIVDSLFEDRYNCILCEDELENPNVYGICHRCMDKLPYNDGHICEKCGKHMVDEATYCITCQKNLFDFDRCRSKFIYEGDIKHLIYKLKYGSKKYLAKYLVEHYVEIYHKYEYSSDVVVCVPISKARRRERGFNQSEEIASLVASRLDIPYVAGVVEKVKDIKPQEEFSGKERIDNVKGAFKLRNIDAIRDKNVLLIDDVLTTGATMGEVARILKKKCKRVDGIVLASPKVKYREEHRSIEDDYDM